MRKNLNVKNVTIYALHIFYGSNTVPHVNTIGNNRQPKIVNFLVSYVAKHIRVIVGCGDTKKNVSVRITRKKIQE